VRWFQFVKFLLSFGRKHGKLSVRFVRTVTPAQEQQEVKTKFELDQERRFLVKNQIGIFTMLPS